MKKEDNLYSIKLCDYTPFLGSMLYMRRNMDEIEKAPNNSDMYVSYLAKGLGLSVVDILTGSACLYLAIQGLEAILK